MRWIAFLLILPDAFAARNYTAVQASDHGEPVVRLADAAKGVEVSILPSMGNRAYQMKVHGKSVLYFPHADAGEFVNANNARQELNGVPFLAPWANRLDGPAFWADGKKYLFNMDLGNVRGALPIHGLLSGSDLWRVTEVAADAKSAHVTSKLAFWKDPLLMAQWPFAHEYEMTYRLAGGVLEVSVSVTNLSSEPMPVSLGFHPYYQIPGVRRDEWTGHIPARKTVVADQRLIPTGEMKPMDVPDPFPLKGRTLDTGFTDLDRDSDGRAHFWIESHGMKVEALFGPKYRVAVVWEPPPPPGETRDFICFEPMTAITNGVNLNHDGKYPDLQMLPPGQKWTESFWIRTSGI